MNSATLRGEPGPLKNFAVLLSDETVGNFSVLHGLPLLVDVVKAISQFTRAYHVDSMRRHFMTRQEIEQKMDELGREYRDTQDSEIPDKMFKLGSQLRELDH